MIKLKYRRLFILIVISTLCSIFIPCTASAQSHQSEQGLMTYSVTTTITGRGSLYWDYGENMSFFLDSGYPDYHSNCIVKTGNTYKFSKLFHRGIIVQPASGYYFDGFYDGTGNKINLTKTNIDILRVSIDGIYYYDYYDAYDNPKYRNYTKKAYKEKVKTYLKTLYGTKRYKVMGSIELYEIPTKNASYLAKFKQKTEPDIPYSPSITKVYGGQSFYVIPSKPTTYTYTFKSSSSKIIKLNKKTGYASIKGPGIATIKCTIKETETTLPATLTIKVTVQPESVASFTAKQKSNKTLALTWKKNTKNSGYEIQVSNNKAFSTILAKKTVSGRNAASTKVKLRTELFNNYARIRPFKKSNGEKIYGPYTTVKITSP